MRRAFVNCRLFDGEREHAGCAVIVEDGNVVDLVDDKDAASLADERVDLDGLQLVPGFVDLQVNGGGGVLLNNTPDLDTVHRMSAGHRRAFTSRARTLTRCAAACTMRRRCGDSTGRRSSCCVRWRRATRSSRSHPNA